MHRHLPVDAGARLGRAGTVARPRCYRPVATGASEPGKPHDMKCTMMQDMHGRMKMNGQTMPQGGGAQHPATGSGGTQGMGEMKCMQGGPVAKPTPAPPSAPEDQHNHDHSGAGAPK